MKLLMTTDTVGGVWTYALDLARALEPRGCRITLATMGAPLTPDQWRQARSHRSVTIRQSSYKLEWMNDPWQDVAAAGRWLLDLEAQVEPDLVHLNGYAHGALPFGAPITVVAHSCVLSWWRAVKGEAAPASWDRYRQAVAEGLDGADVVVAPTQAMLATLEENYLPLRQTRVIPNGRQTQLYRRRTKETFVLTAGRLWDEAKNLSAMQAAAPALPWPVCVAGQEKSPDGQGDVDSGNVLFLGHLAPDRLADWYSRAPIYALPARYEPFGLSALEAALCGCALVLGDIPSLREVWGDAAVFVPPDDVGRLRRELHRLIDDPTRRELLARRAQYRASHYSLSRMGEAYASLYQHVLDRRAAVDAPRLEADVLVPHAAQRGGV